MPVAAVLPPLLAVPLSLFVRPESLSTESGISVQIFKEFAVNLR